MKNRITENDIKRLIKRVIKEDEDINMMNLRKAVEDYKQKHTSPEISKKTGEPVKSTGAPFKGYHNITDDDVPLNVRQFYNDFKKKLSIFNLKPSKLTKAEILDVLDKILTLNGFN